MKRLTIALSLAASALLARIASSAGNGGLRQALTTSRAAQFARHYIEMVVAMFVAMFASYTGHGGHDQSAA